MKKLWKKLLAAGMSLAMVFNVAGVSTVYTQATAQELASEGEVMEMIVELPEIGTSAPAISWFSLSEGVVDLKEGNYEKWIDRLDLSEAAFAKDFYASLEEGTDNDGVDDWLIEDSFF